MLPKLAQFVIGVSLVLFLLACKAFFWSIYFFFCPERDSQLKFPSFRAARGRLNTISEERSNLDSGFDSSDFQESPRQMSPKKFTPGQPAIWESDAEHDVSVWIPDGVEGEA